MPQSYLFDMIKINLMHKMFHNCNIIKSLQYFEFRKDRNKYRPICRKCRQAQQRLYVKINFEKRNKYKKIYITKNNDKIKEYYIKNKKTIKEKQKDYYIINKDKINLRLKIYNQNNKEKRKKLAQKYFQKYKKEIYNREKERIKNDLNYKISKNLRTRLNHAIHKNPKSGSAICDLGCSMDFLKKHLESKFYSDLETGKMMTWENYGKLGWHIDHIKPLSSFNLIDKEELKKACHYTNLQPMWAKENIIKSNK